MALKVFVKPVKGGAFDRPPVPGIGLASALEANRLLAQAGYAPNGQAIVKRQARVKCQGTDKRKTPTRQAIVKPADPFLLAWEAALSRENETRERNLRAALRASQEA